MKTRSSQQLKRLFLGHLPCTFRYSVKATGERFRLSFEKDHKKAYREFLQNKKLVEQFDKTVLGVIFSGHP